MPADTTPAFGCTLLHPTLRVRELEVARTHYLDSLGFEGGFVWGEPPTLAGVDLGEVSLHLRSVESESPIPLGEVYFVVDDVDRLHQFQAERGAAIEEPPADRPWGFREFAVRDLDGHLLRFGQRQPAKEPALTIERVKIEARVERRLATVLDALAEEQGRSRGQCLEEILLHAFERTEDGRVASPYSKATLKHIERLKAEHGLEYDAHACYRFVEEEPGNDSEV